MMRGHGITTALADVRAATVAACFLEESADLQMRMLAAAGGDASGFAHSRARRPSSPAIRPVPASPRAAGRGSTTPPSPRQKPLGG